VVVPQSSASLNVDICQQLRQHQHSTRLWSALQVLSSFAATHVSHDLYHLHCDRVVCSLVERLLLVSPNVAAHTWLALQLVV
jgi:hypothetical protein